MSVRPVPAQVTLNQVPGRVLGHPQLAFTTLNPNLVEGRELYAPQGIALDTSASPPIVYVSDTGNHRVLAWKNASQFRNGAPADLVIGQKDRFTTFAQGPGTTFSTGLNSPTGLAVKDGNLYIVDSGNNRILRFPKPFAQTEQFPDMVIGQPNFSSKLPNQGGLPAANTIALASGSTVFRAGITFDGSGNLWVPDAGNRRVLRFPASAIASGGNGASADLVLGQADFTSLLPPLSISNAASRLVKNQFVFPSAVAFDPAGRLFVSDSDAARPDQFSRVLVFTPPYSNGTPANRILGIVVQVQGQPPVPDITVGRIAMIDPEGIFMIGSSPAIVDSLSHRILIFDPFEQWPEESATAPSPQARAVIGHLNDFVNRKPNNGQPEPSGSTLAGPVAAVMAGSELFVADAGNHRVLVLPDTGPFAVATRVLGQDQFNFYSPNLIEGREFDFVTQTTRGNLADAGLAVDRTSDPPHLYVADPYNNRILGFKDLRKVKPGDKADIVIGQPDMFRSLCNYPGNDINRPSASSLCQPAGVAVDPDGNLWVADTGNARVLRFAKPFAGSGFLPQADLVLGQNSFNGKITDPSTRTLAAPYGLAFAQDAGLLVSDVVHNRVLFFPKASGYVSGMAATKVFGQPDFTSIATGADDNRMNGPRHISSDPEGRLYVADTNNNRLLIFGPAASQGNSDAHAAVVLASGIRSPRGVNVDPQSGEIWVTDTNGVRSLRFPKFDQLPINNFSSNFQIPANTNPIALTQDQFGALYVADTANRIAIYYPGLSAINGASYLVNRALTPGAIASVFPFGNQFGSETARFDQLPNPLPLPKQLGDVQVLVNGQPAPLFFVSPGQINIQVPWSAPTSGSVDMQVLRASTGQVLGSGAVRMNTASPALFTLNSTGRGQIAAVNQDGTVNSSTNPAPRNSVIALYATGQGPVSPTPPDGDVPQDLVQTPVKPRVIIGPAAVPDDNVQFSGLAPGFVGLWQINVKIPDTVAPGSQIPVIVQYNSINSNGDTTQQVTTTIAVKQ